MAIGSHNSMTYLKPKCWWMKCFNFIAQCQNKTIIEQYNLGVKTFDIRITYIDGVMYFAHGLITYSIKNITPYQIFKIINSFPKKCTVRIILESKNIWHKKKFKEDVTYFINTFKNINFVEGVCKYGWEKLINIPAYNGIQCTASTTGSIIDDWFPRLYAMFKNKKIIDKYKSTEQCVLIDFVGNYYK